MLYFKDTENKVHALEDLAFAYLLPTGCEEIGEDEARVLYAPPLTTGQQIAANKAAVQSEMNRQAQLLDYDDIFTAISYAGNEVLADPIKAKFQAQGNAFKAWRSDVWATAVAVENEVAAGTRPMPTPEESVAMMPALVLP